MRLCRACSTVARLAAFAGVMGGATAGFGTTRVGERVVERGDEPAPTAGVGAEAGVLRFRVTGDAGGAIPCRLTFTRREDPSGAPELFPNTQAAPDELAVRRNVVYSLRGEGAITVPPGKYEAHASRGLEWSIESKAIEVRAGVEVLWEARLRHEVDTAGWVSGDFHLHTLTHSGHGDANMNERIISLLGEGVEFAVATDHNHHTDYGPTVAHLHAHDELATAVGNEVSTPIGHFNTFPLDPGRPIANHRLDDARALFALLRAEPNAEGITPVIQLNHPRWGGIDYFGRAGLDPVTARATTERYSEDFDSLEILNENEGWGYYHAGVDDVPTGESEHSVLLDWFNLLNQGAHYTGVGNSDSHTVHFDFAGYPRNFIPSATDKPGEIRAADVARAIREGRTFTTTGPFVEFVIDGAGMGEVAMARNGHVTLRVRVRAASWVDCDRVKIVRGGDVVATLPASGSREVVRVETTLAVPTPGDTWITLLVEGDEGLLPLLPDQGRVIRPLAVLNPIWVDADGDGRVLSPVDQAAALVRGGASAPRLLRESEAMGPTFASLLILAAGEQRSPLATELARHGLASKSRRERIAAARVAEVIADASLLGELDVLAHDREADGYLRVAALRAIGAIEPARLTPLLTEFVGAGEGELLRANADELAANLPGAVVDRWSVLGYFAAPSIPDGVSSAMGPEIDDAGRFSGADGTPLQWRTLESGTDGIIDLRRIDMRPDRFHHAAAFARVWVWSEQDGARTPYAFGADDGSVLWLNGEKIYEDSGDHRATPLGHVGTLTLRKGWNTVLAKVVNGTGEFGFTFRFLQDGVRWQETAPAGEP